MGSYADGIADAIQDGNMRRAQASASSANLRALNAERDRDTAMAGQRTAEGDAAYWKQEAHTLRDMYWDAGARHIGAVAVIKGVMDLMERMPADVREEFRASLVQRARGHMTELAAMNEKFPVMTAFAKTTVNKTLGVV